MGCRELISLYGQAKEFKKPGMGYCGTAAREISVCETSGMCVSCKHLIEVSLLEDKEMRIYWYQVSPFITVW